MKIFRKYTLKSLAKNHTRTLVTIIGIILSAAMFSAVTTFVASLQNYMLDTIIFKEGPWVGKIAALPREQLHDLEQKNEVSKVMYIENIGYSPLENCLNDNKPYLFVGAYSQSFADTMPINLTSGRMPSNSNEIILPDHLSVNGGISHKIGDVLELTIGYRAADNGENVKESSAGGQTPWNSWEKLGQGNFFRSEESVSGTELSAETFVPTETHTYTVVGFYARPTFEDFTAPGYTALTVYNSEKSTADADYDAYFIMDDMRNAQGFVNENFPDYDSCLHTDLMRYSGVFTESGLNQTLYSMAAVLMGIIMFASIALIYNAFSISVSERTKQFGLLSSIGATRKQLMSTVIFESLALSVVGIPLGLLSGYGGIAVTLKLTENLFATSFGIDSTGTVKFHAVISWWAMLIAAIICLITVIISAYIPARRATKLSAIEAIRQSGDIKIRPGKVRTSKLTYKLFGFEGMIASKNFKRNKKKYRSTVMSLFVSVLLFISSSSFCAYLTKSIGDVATEQDIDLTYVATPELFTSEEMVSLYKDFGKIDTITGSNYIYNLSGEMSLSKDAANTDPDFLEVFSDLQIEAENNTAKFSYITLIFLEENYYKEFLQSNNFNTEKYLNTENPTALAICHTKVYRNNKYYVNDAFVKENFQAIWVPFSDSDDKAESSGVQLQIGEHTDKCPLGLSSSYGSNIMLLYPESARKKIDAASEGRVAIMCFTSSNPTDAEGKMVKLLEDKHLSTNRITNYAATMDSERNLILLVKIFSTGFIVLISLISAANVFNTISTNINLRRREFAMLKSIGMTRRGFNKMMNYECLLYGLKGLIYGIPAAVGVTYLIYHSMQYSIDVSFFVPADSVIIAVGSVFLVVFATMLYSMSKVKKENTVDALKTEVF